MPSDPKLPQFKYRLTILAVLVSVSSVVGLVVVARYQPDLSAAQADRNLGATAYTAIAAVLSTFLGIGLISLIYEFFLRKHYAKSLHQYLNLKSALVSSGLSDVLPTNSGQLNIREDIARAGIIRAIARNPNTWVVNYLNSVMSAAEQREVHVQILLPDKESSHFDAVARSLGVSSASLRQNIDAARDTIQVRWQDAEVHKNSSISVAALEVPLYDILVADGVAMIEFHASTDHSPGRNGLALKFVGYGHPTTWLRAQLDSAAVKPDLWAAGSTYDFESGGKS